MDVDPLSAGKVPASQAYGHRFAQLAAQTPGKAEVSERARGKRRATTEDAEEEVKKTVKRTRAVDSTQDSKATGGDTTVAKRSKLEPGTAVIKAVYIIPCNLVSPGKSKVSYWILPV